MNNKEQNETIYIDKAGENRSYKFGNTTYLVNLKFNISSEKIDEIILRLIKKEIEKNNK